MRVMKVRAPAVAGRFYESSPERLKHEVEQWLSGSADAQPLEKLSTKALPIKALIVPHAGYVFSGKVAAEAYQYLKPLSQQFRKVILIGPSHRVGFEGAAVPAVDYFATPLGNVKIDKDLVRKLSNHPQIRVMDRPHADEHSLEVQLPFLQSCLDDFILLPIVYSKISPSALADIVNAVWQGDDTLLVVSSDLSHFHNYDQACSIDRTTRHRIAAFDATIEPQEACGATGINMLLKLAKQRGYALKELDYKNSGDTGGNKARVVGYVSYLISAV